MLSGRYGFNIEIRAMFRDKRFKEHMNLLELFLEFLAIFLSVLTKHRHGSLVFTRSNLFEVHSFRLQCSEKIRDLCDNANRTNHRKGRGHNAIGNTGHQITPTRGDFVNDNGQWNSTVSDPK